MANVYPSYKTLCGWNALLPSRTPSPVLEGDQSADVVVVGAGFTGVACARQWQRLSSHSRVVVIDSSEVGEGNPGRNSGFLLEIALADDADPTSTQRMEACNQLTRAAMREIAEDVKASGASVDLQRAGTYRAAAGNAGIEALGQYQTFLDAAGLTYRRLDHRDLERELGTRFYSAGLFSQDCYLAQPAALIRSLVASLPESIDVYENSPLLGFNRVKNGWLLRCPAGEIRSRILVLANNAFAKALGVAKPRLSSVFTYAGLTPVLEPDVLANLGENQNWGILPMHRLGSTLRRTVDGRLLVRSLHDWEREGDSTAVRRALLDRLARRFPQLAGRDFEHVWGGAVGFTYNAAPVWGEVEPGLFIAGGCNGGGTVKGTLFGKLLADLAHGDETVPDVEALFGRASWMPPEPLRRVGFQVKATIESWQGRQER
ncbi:MAG: FAD-binding oxidoreductase [Pseudomonadota bacterium]